VLPGVLDDLYTDLVARSGDVDDLVLDLYGVDPLSEVARVAFDVNRVTACEFPVRKAQRGYTDVAKVMGDNADLVLSHSAHLHD